MKHKALAFVLITIAAFLTWKLPNVVFRFGDGNAYLYMAKEFFSGTLPYRDFFLADPPFLVLFLVPFMAVFKSHLLFFQVLPICIEAITSFLLYLIAKKRGETLDFLVPLFYLFSFSVLATSDYLTGIQLTVFLVVLAFLLDEYGHPIFSGVSWALSILTKMYALPVFVGFLILKLISKKSDIWKIILSAFVSGIIVMSPFLLIAFGSIWKYMVVHQFHRPPGLDKWHVWSFFLQREWFFIIFGTAGLFIRKNRYLVFPFILSAIFFLSYSDLYYLYLQTLLPFLVLGTSSIISLIWERKDIQAALIPVGVLYLVFIVQSVYIYKTQFYVSDRFLNDKEVVSAINKLPDAPLYGTHEITPLLALLTNRKLAGNYIDTNTQAFASGGEDIKLASQTAIRAGAYLVGRVTDLPQYGIKDAGMDGYFDKTLFRYCRKALKLPSTSGGQDNFIGVYKCSSDSL